MKLTTTTRCLAFLLLLLINGCNEGISFDKPQPPDSKPLPIFPMRIRGSYANNTDNAVITIKSNMVIKSYDFDFKGTLRQLDSTAYEMHHDSIFNKNSGEGLKVNLIKDTILAHVFLADTIFIISDVNVLKKYKGYYFLNKEIGNGQWLVNVLSLSKGFLCIAHLRDSVDISHLKEISESKEDSTGYHFKPTQKQFEKFIKQEGFREKDTFYRVRSASQ